MYLGHYGDSSLSKSVIISCINRSVEDYNTGIYIIGYKTSPNKSQVILK